MNRYCLALLALLAGCASFTNPGAGRFATARNGAGAPVFQIEYKSPEDCAAVLRRDFPSFMYGTIKSVECVGTEERSLHYRLEVTSSDQWRAPVKLRALTANACFDAQAEVQRKGETTLKSYCHARD